MTSPQQAWRATDVVVSLVLLARRRQAAIVRWRGEKKPALAVLRDAKTMEEATGRPGAARQIEATLGELH